MLVDDDRSRARDAPGELRGPSGVVCENGQLFVVEGGNHRVQKLALRDGAVLGAVGRHGDGDVGRVETFESKSNR